MTYHLFCIAVVFVLVGCAMSGHKIYNFARTTGRLVGNSFTN